MYQMGKNNGEKNSFTVAAECLLLACSTVKS